MEQKRKRSVEEIEHLLEGYKKSGLTRRQYCEQQGIPLTTLDYYHRTHAKQTASKPPSPGLIKVTVKASAGEESIGFTLMLGNGRSIVCAWGYEEAQLVRLIRITEAV